MGEERNKDAGADVRPPFYTDFDKLARTGNNNNNSNRFRNTGNKHGACNPRAFGSSRNTPDIDTNIDTCRSRCNNNPDIPDDNDNDNDNDNADQCDNSSSIIDFDLITESTPTLSPTPATTPITTMTFPPCTPQAVDIAISNSKLPETPNDNTNADTTAKSNYSHMLTQEGPTVSFRFPFLFLLPHT